MYVVLTAILGRHVLAHLGTSIANDPGDPLLTAAILEWNARHLPWSDAWWQFPIFHPTPDTLAFSEHLLGLSVIASPLAWLTGNPLATYNLTTLLTFPLSAMAMFALVYYLTRSGVAAFLAGLAYGFAPYRISNLPHVQMLASFWAPLALLGLHGYVDRHVRGSDAAHLVGVRLTRDKWLVLYGAAWALQAAANGYALVFFSVLVGLWVLWFVVLPRRWTALAGIAVATVIAALPLAPILYTYITVHARHGFERSAAEMRAYSADVAAVLCAPPDLAVWGWIRVACRAEGELFPGVALFAIAAAACYVVIARRPEAPPLRTDDTRGPDQPPPGLRRSAAASAEADGPRLLTGGHRGVAIAVRVLMAVAALYAAIVVSVLVIGPWRIDVAFIHVSASEIDKPLLIALACAVAALLVSLAAHAKQTGSTLAFYLFAALATWLLALGPTITLMGELSGRPGPFAVLQALPGVSGLRVPARFWLMAQMCLSASAGIFLAQVFRRPARWRAVAAAALAIGLVADGWSAPIPARDAPASVPDPHALRGQVVLQLPLDPFSDMASTWRAVEGGWRAVNGYSGYGPNYYAALTLAAEAADPALFRPFRRDHDLHVVVADDAAEQNAAVARQPGAVVTARGNGSTQYLLPRRAASPAPVGTRVPIASVDTPCAEELVAVVTDGDPRTLWDCVEPAETHRLTIDLGRRVLVEGVIYSLGPYFWNPPTRLAIETSGDGLRWEPARSGSVLGEFIEGGLADPASLRALLRFAPREARYLRLRPESQREEFAWFVSELEVLAPRR